MSVEHGEWTIERTYPADPARVFAAWADAAVKVRWFVGPAAADDDDGAYTSDFRVGGAETYRGEPGAGPQYTYEAVYRDIVDAERIVSTYEMSVDGVRMSVSVATAQFLPDGESTRLVYTEQGVYLDGLDTPDQRRSGVGTQLTRLAEELT